MADMRDCEEFYIAVKCYYCGFHGYIPLNHAKFDIIPANPEEVRGVRCPKCGALAIWENAEDILEETDGSEY